VQGPLPQLVGVYEFAAWRVWRLLGTDPERDEPGNIDGDNRHNHPCRRLDMRNPCTVAYPPVMPDQLPADCAILLASLRAAQCTYAAFQVRQDCPTAHYAVEGAGRQLGFGSFLTFR
jgi:hypothetical protein